MPRRNADPSVFPLTDALLPQARLTSSDRRELRLLARQTAQIALRDGKTWARTNLSEALGREKWQVLSMNQCGTVLVKHQREHSSFRGRKQANYHSTDIAATTTTGGECFMMHAQVASSLEDIASSFYSETTEQFRHLMRQKYREHYLDSSVIATLDCAKATDPFWYVGLKWVAFKSPSKLVNSREFVFLEHSGSRVNANGDRMVYRVLRSVNLSRYGGKASYGGLTRGHIDVVFVYWIDAHSYSDHVANIGANGRIHLKGKLPMWLVFKFLKKVFRSKGKRGINSSSEASFSITSVDFSSSFHERPSNMTSYTINDKQRSYSYSNYEHGQVL